MTPEIRTRLLLLPLAASAIAWSAGAWFGFNAAPRACAHATTAGSLLTLLTARLQRRTGQKAQWTPGRKLALALLLGVFALFVVAIMVLGPLPTFQAWNALVITLLCTAELARVAIRARSR